VDLVDVLILVLRLVFVALLYLFVVVVLRLAIRGLRPAPAGKVRVDARLDLVVLEAGGSGLSPGEVIAVSVSGASW